MKCNHYITSYASSYSTITYVFSFCTTNYFFAPTSDYVLLTFSSTDLIYGSTSSGYICDYSSFVVVVVFIYFCFKP